MYSAGSDDSSAPVVPSGVPGVSEGADSSLVGEANWVDVVVPQQPADGPGAVTSGYVIIPGGSGQTSKYAGYDGKRAGSGGVDQVYWVVSGLVSGAQMAVYPVVACPGGDVVTVTGAGQASVASAASNVGSSGWSAVDGAADGSNWAAGESVGAVYSVAGFGPGVSYVDGSDSVASVEDPCGRGAEAYAASVAGWTVPEADAVATPYASGYSVDGEQSSDYSVGESASVGYSDGSAAQTEAASTDDESYVGQSSYSVQPSYVESGSGYVMMDEQAEGPCSAAADVSADTAWDAGSGSEAAGAVYESVSYTYGYAVVIDYSDASGCKWLPVGVGGAVATLPDESGCVAHVTEAGFGQAQWSASDRVGGEQYGTAVGKQTTKGYAPVEPYAVAETDAWATKCSSERGGDESDGWAAGGYVAMYQIEWHWQSPEQADVGSGVEVEPSVEPSESVQEDTGRADVGWISVNHSNMKPSASRPSYVPQATVKFLAVIGVSGGNFAFNISRQFYVSGVKL